MHRWRTRAVLSSLLSVGELGSQRRRALGFGVAVEYEGLTEDELNPRWVGVGRAFAVVDDRADAAAEDDVSEHARVDARNRAGHRIRLRGVRAGYVQIFARSSNLRGRAGLHADHSIIVAELALRSPEQLSGFALGFDLDRVGAVVDDRSASGAGNRDNRSKQ